MPQKQPAPAVNAAWYHQTKWASLIALVSLLAAYGIGSRSLDTGSWQQYFMTLFLLLLAANRSIHVMKALVRRHA